MDIKRRAGTKDKLKSKVEVILSKLYLSYKF